MHPMKFIAERKTFFRCQLLYVENEDEAQTLEVTLHDAVMDTDLILSYTIYEEYPVLTRNAKICHKGSEKIVLDKIMSASVEFNDMDYEMVHLSRRLGKRALCENQKTGDGYPEHPELKRYLQRRGAESVPGTETSTHNRKSGRSIRLQPGIQRQSSGTGRSFYF